MSHFPPLSELCSLGIRIDNRSYDILVSTLCGKSCVELGEKHGITRTRVRQLYYNILSKIYKIFVQYALENARLVEDNHALKEINKQNFEEHLQKQMSANLDKLINDLDLTERTRKCLVSIKIVSIRDLINKSEYEMLAIPGFGVKCLYELKRVLAKMGLHFAY